MRGARAQEEDLYRRSDMFRHNRSYIHFGQTYPLADAALVRNAGKAMATQGVLIFRDCIEKGYEMTAMARQVTVIAAVAPFKPRITMDAAGKQYYARTEDRPKMYATILAILEADAEAECKVLFLSAFGCGAFSNPAREVAELFCSALTKYQDKCKAVVFAIMDEIFDLKRPPPSDMVAAKSNCATFDEVFAFYNHQKEEKASEEMTAKKEQASSPGASGFPEIHSSRQQKERRRKMTTWPCPKNQTSR